MLSYVIRRTLILIPVLIGMTIMTFSIVHLIPGNPAQTILGDQARPETVAALEKRLGLNEPYPVQYAIYVKDLLQGNLGESLRTKAPISTEIVPYFMATLELTVSAMLIATVVGINAGIVSAWKHNSIFDYVVMLMALIGVSMPIFWLGLMQQWLFSQELGWLPAFGRDDPRNPVEPITYLYVVDAVLAGNWDHVKDVLRHLVLPATALATIPMAVIARMTRSSMLEVLRSDFVRTAQAKGVRPFFIIYKHGLRNAMIPVLTVIGLQAGTLLGGALLTETIFSWPGIGRYIYEAIGYRDYPVIQSGVLVIAFMFVIINFIVDLLYAYLDPRIRYE